MDFNRDGVGSIRVNRKCFIVTTMLLTFRMLMVLTLTMVAGSEDSLVHILKGICPVGYFQCVNDTICVPQNNQCNGQNDCPSASDELDCDDKFDNEYYDHLYRKNPIAEHDDFNQTCGLSYKGACLCRARDLLCHHLQYSKAPGDLPREFIDILDFHGNNFTVLSGDSLETVPDNVNKLSLVHCNVGQITPGAFFLLRSLRYLHLSNNHLKTIPPNIFPPENHLMTSLMHNAIVSIHPDAFVNLKYLIELDLRGNQIEKVDGKVFINLQSLAILYLQNNRIKYLPTDVFPPLPVYQISLADNKITVIEEGAFSNLASLKSLYISNNRLEHISNGTFKNLTNLEGLTLNDNVIDSIEAGAFQDVPRLTSLKLERNRFRSVDKAVLAPLKNLHNIYFDRFEMCSFAAHVRVCQPHGDGISSHEHLLDNIILRTCVWVIGAVGLAGNLLVLLGRMFAPANNVVHSLYLRNLALSDLLMGVYLFIIASADTNYRGVYLRYQYLWRHSYVCNICGFLSTLSCESSVLILALVTWDRFISVTQPLARKQPSPRAAALTLLALWSVAVLIAIFPIGGFARAYFGDEFYGNNGVCLSLHIHEPYAKGWEYSAVMFIMVNAMALVFISYAYLRMIQEIRASGVACRSTRQSRDRDKVAQRFGIIVLTDCLCWVPVIVVKLVALAGVPIPEKLYAWLAIFILPINSALNPVLYTLMTTVFKKQLRKLVNSCVHKSKPENMPQSASESGFSLSFGMFPLSGSTKRGLTNRVMKFLRFRNSLSLWYTEQPYHKQEQLEEVDSSVKTGSINELLFNKIC
ncbi:relaxin receptor 2 isoform X2 [Cylas formicarius]|uniref:relaxin receptor 2 isoform X2 n=1 Tax=Cylas formicarius TaxID=197179 RepID=UPI002958DE47|nr:relaxin receptor 2 isoform X2 [Cylas formicarius]